MPLTFWTMCLTIQKGRMWGNSLYDHKVDTFLAEVA